MPELVNRRVSSCGIRLEDATGVWPRCAKKSMKAARSSSAVRTGVRGGDTVQNRTRHLSPQFRAFCLVTASIPSPRRSPDTAPSFAGALHASFVGVALTSRVSVDGAYRPLPDG